MPREEVGLILAWLLACEPSDAVPSDGSVSVGGPAPTPAPALPDPVTDPIEPAVTPTVAPFPPGLDHDPSSAAYLDDIVTRLALTPAERARVAATGLVVTRPPSGTGSYAELYRGIYGRDLPVLITLDSLWFAVQHAYVDGLDELEWDHLTPQLLGVLDAVALALPVPATGPDADVDVVIAIARALGAPREWGVRPPQAVAKDQANQPEVDRLYALALTEADAEVELRGLVRPLPLSRLRPQGRNIWTGKEWWRMATWLQVTSFVVADEDGPHARELEAAVELARLVRLGGAEDRLASIDTTLGGLVGPPDGVSPADLLAALPELEHRDSDGSARWLAKRFAGREHVRGEARLGKGPGPSGPLPTTVSLLPGRTTFDSHVLTEITRDVPAAAAPPSPLAVLYVLGADPAGDLLCHALTGFAALAGPLTRLRAEADRRDRSDWEDDVHDRWLDVIRAANAPDLRRPAVFASTSGQRRLLQTELVAWTWLRSDHAAFAEESGEEGACSFPDVYVDPYPAAWRAMAELARVAASTLRRAGVQRAPLRLEAVAAEIDGLARAADSLLDAGHLDDATGEHLRSFIVSPQSYGVANYSGWYPALFAEGQYLATPGVFTRMFRGNAAFGGGQSVWLRASAPTLLVVTVQTGHGPAAFVGPVQTFRTVVTAEAPSMEEDDLLWAGEEPAWLAGLRAEPTGTYTIPRKDKFTAVEESGEP